MEQFTDSREKVLQECEARFGTYYQISARFLKVARYIDDISYTNLGNSAQAAYASLKKNQILTGMLMDIQVSKLLSMHLE